MKRWLEWAFPILVGMIFSIGLGVSGMTEPAKIIGFLDLFGNWDPSLVFVMLGALFVNVIFYNLSRRFFKKPIFGKMFFLPVKKDLDKKLIIGALIFGVGWGISGLCPGPALTTLVSGSSYIISFVGAMLIGMFLTRRTLG